VTSSRVVTMTEAEFRDECEQRGGVFEVIPHCGGLTTCRGMSYDTTTSTLTDHTCRGVNTCAGYSCVICD
ncbi:MAG: hypothetical protein OZ921_06235, partial [Sorangiineae bacterium]|nr:hypothetical protein [Sorangiineae bacterium]